MGKQRISRDGLQALGARRLAEILVRLAADHEAVRAAVGAALEPGELAAEAAGADEPPEVQESYMVGSSPAMRTVFEAIRKYASVDAPVLITGESGTGKELAAHAIHERSARADGPFVVIDCAALPPTLIASELFGHEKGAFTGAHERKTGRIERAAGGTVFLDEIGDLSLELQANLLRFLQEGTVERLGGRGPRHVDARVIAATNVDLGEAVAEGRFRRDLFYRLDVLTLDMPALRDRPEDIGLLAQFFLEKLGTEMGRPVRGLTKGARAALEAHDWPGNVRELIACLRRAIVMAEGETITREDLGLGPDRPRAGGASARAPGTLEQVRSEAESRLIRETLRIHRHNIKRAADELKVSRPTLYRLMEKHQIAAHGDPDPGSGSS